MHRRLAGLRDQRGVHPAQLGDAQLVQFPNAMLMQSVASDVRTEHIRLVVDGHVSGLASQTQRTGHHKQEVYG